jgi:hypothetical protein
MPGLLKPDFKCPLCGQLPVMVIHVWGKTRAEFEYDHGDGQPSCFRRFSWREANEQLAAESACFRCHVGSTCHQHCKHGIWSEDCPVCRPCEPVTPEDEEVDPDD